VLRGNKVAARSLRPETTGACPPPTSSAAPTRLRDNCGASHALKDLCRTASTLVSKLGFSPTMSSISCHNHIKPGMSGRRDAQQARIRCAGRTTGANHERRQQHHPYAGSLLNASPRTPAIFTRRPGSRAPRSFGEWSACLLSSATSGALPAVWATRWVAPTTRRSLEIPRARMVRPDTGCPGGPRPPSGDRSRLSVGSGYPLFKL